MRRSKSSSTTTGSAGTTAPFKRPRESSTCASLSLKDQVQHCIHQFLTLQQDSGQYIEEDILRHFIEISKLQLETQQMRQAFVRNPFVEHSTATNHVTQYFLSLQPRVRDCHRTCTREGYSHIQALVSCDQANLQFSFQYERTQSSLTYLIRTLSSVPSKEEPLSSSASSCFVPILWLHLWHQGQPSSHPPELIQNDDDDEEEEEDNETMDTTSVAVLPTTETNEDETAKPKTDRYYAGMDVEYIMESWGSGKDSIISHCSSNSEESDIFFLLMSFPFYEQEWDIVELLWRAIFDMDDESSTSDIDG